jgi:hypothetical protein
VNGAALYKEEAPYSYLRGFFRFPYGEVAGEPVVGKGEAREVQVLIIG